MLLAPVYAQFTSSSYLAAQCELPIPENVQSDYAGTTCLSLMHAGQAYRSYAKYMSNFRGYSIESRDDDMGGKSRTNPQGAIDEYTPFAGSWIDTQDNRVDDLSMRHQRLVINVTAALPHAGVLHAL